MLLIYDDDYIFESLGIEFSSPSRGCYLSILSRIYFTKGVLVCFRPLLGGVTYLLNVLFLRMYKTCLVFVPFSGVLPIYTSMTEHDIKKHMFSSPSPRYYLSMNRDRQQQHSICFRPLLGVLLIYLNGRLTYGLFGKCFRPLLGVLLIYIIQNILS